MKEALFYRSGTDGEVVCELCAHGCRIRDRKTGLCGVRMNRDGKLYSQVYGKAVATHVDPIEKKPLFHFQPGSRSFSMATVGCNFRCRHCQNAEISQMPVDKGRIVGTDISPEQIVSQALEEGCRSISYTYTEPTVYFEFAYDTARRAVQAGLKNIFVTNGYIAEAPLKAIQPWLHAANVDLKSFQDRFYRDVCNARLGPVLDTLQRIKKMDIWLEVTTLLIPGWNDDPSEIRDLARFIKGLGAETPWHVSAYHPAYRMNDRARTPLETLRRAWEVGREEGLLFVYTGNVPGDKGEHTECPHCGTCVIKRLGFRILEMNLKQGRCGQCGQALPVRGDEGPAVQAGHPWGKAG